jgi:membrane-bound ClpP family serine protease
MALMSIVIVVFLLSLGLGAFFLYIAFCSRHLKAGGGRLNLMGVRASVGTALEPDGSILVKGELWRARVKPSQPLIPPGHIVRIVGVDGHFLVVEATE